MLGLATNRVPMAYRAMVQTGTPKRISEREALGLALKRLRLLADLTQPEAGERAGVGGTTWRRYELGQRGLGLDQLEPLARAVGVTVDRLLEERGRALADPHRLNVTASPEHIPPRSTFLAFPSPTVLPVRDRVQAGAWLAADDTGNARPRFLPTISDPRYPHAEQWLSEVDGDSVDKLFIFSGDYVHCVDAIGIGYSPRTGDIVEVERLRFGGQERELTLKQIEVSPGGELLLWPRSTNPRWQEPLRLAEGTDFGEEVEVRIRGLIISAIRRFP